MRRSNLIPAAIFFIFFMFASAVGAEYAVMIAKNVNIRTGPGMDNYIVCRGEKGDLYNYVGEEGDWYMVEMFSGEIRYIGKSVGARLTEQQLLPGHNMAVPESEGRRMSIFRDIEYAKDRAKKEAGEIIPEVVDRERYENFRAIREDGNILYIMHVYGVQPALYDEIIKEGERKGW
ncbi:MAG: SH3 domain-containing protein [Candidatus Zixiibacteriota bacterium]|nr:MAG: SH3 domain-containing protein [candidate division Zixibacteria bacterium]